MARLNPVAVDDYNPEQKRVADMISAQRNAPVRLIGLFQMPITNHIISNTVILLSTSFVVGLCIGSFLNVVAYRLPIIYQHNYTKQCREFLSINEPPIKESAWTDDRVFKFENSFVTLPQL